MSSNPQNQPHGSDGSPEGTPIDSAEHREKIMRKLNCLIAVLDVACTKVRRSLAGPNPDIERLTRIQANLTKTLKVCRKAKLALERREALPDDLPASLSQVVGEMNQSQESAAKKRRMPTGAYIEMSSNSEVEKFRLLGPIDKHEFTSLDFDELAAKLQG